MEKHLKKNSYMQVLMNYLLLQLLAIVLVTGNVFANKVVAQDLLAQKVTLNVKQREIRDVLTDLERGIGIKFVYSSRNVSRRKVTMELVNAPLLNALQELFRPEKISTKVIGGRVVINVEPTRVNDASPAIRQDAAAERSIAGTVKDEKGEALPGVSVVIKNTQRGTVTDVQGMYTLTLPDGESVLVFSYVGYLPQEVTAGNQSKLDISLKEDTKALDEVVVVGYGTQKKSDLTGAVSRLDTKQFESQSATNLLEYLSGTVPGFNSDQGVSASGGGTMEIRGPKSLNANTAPLIVLDGVIFNGSIQDINPNDIESVDFLKDASSAAVFGARSASGVVIVNTKKGQSGKPTINFSTTVGVATVTNQLKPYNASGYMDFRRDYYKVYDPNRPAYYFHNPSELPADISLDTWRKYSDNPNADNTAEWLNRLNFTNTEIQNYQAGKATDWYKKVVQQGLRQNYDLSLSGGTTGLKYYMSAGYTDNKGIILGDQFKTFRARLNIEANVTDFISIGMYNQFSSSDSSQIKANLGQMYRASPYGSMFEEDGLPRLFPHEYTGATNPLIDNYYQDRMSRSNAIFSTLFTNIKLPLGFSYRLSFQNRLAFNKNYDFWPSTTPTGGISHINGYGLRLDANTYEWMIDNIVKWNREFGKHSLDFTFLFNLERLNTQSSLQTNENFAPNENLSYNGLHFGSNPTLLNDDTQRTADALMFRLNYNYDDRYLLTASWRRDGFSAFGQGNPRAVFPALALSWRLSKEKFFNVDWIGQLKVRTSWGLNGNRDIGTYAALARLSSNLYYDGSKVLNGVFNATLANANLRWEKTETFNAGLDLTLLKGRMDITADAYVSNTRDLLMNRQLPTMTGYTAITTNLGRLSNKGIELSVNTFNVKNPKWTWNSNLVFSMNRNKIEELWGDRDANGNHVPDYTNRWFPGQAIDRIWDYNITGVWQSNEKEVAKSYSLTEGDLKAVDVNKDNIYRALDDKVFLGWERPRYRLGLRNTFTFFGNFEALFFLRADLGHSGSLGNFKHGDSNIYDRVNTQEFPYWTKENPSNKYPRLNVNNAAYEGGVDVYLPRSFMRLQDVSISYSVPKSRVQKLRLNNLKLFVSARNAYTLTKWEGWDPESGSVPMPKTYSIGLSLNL